MSQQSLRPVWKAAVHKKGVTTDETYYVIDASLTVDGCTTA